MTDTLAARLRSGVYGINRIALCSEAADALDAQAAEIAAQAKRIAELEAALNSLCDAADDTNYPRHGPSWDRLWNTAVAARMTLAALRKEQEAAK